MANYISTCPTLSQLHVEDPALLTFHKPNLCHTTAQGPALNPSFDILCVTMQTSACSGPVSLRSCVQPCKPGPGQTPNLMFCLPPHEISSARR